MEEGRNVWLFPDGELPEPDMNSLLQAHEALIILNTSGKDAKMKMSLYFTDKDPVENIALEVKAKRVKCIRLDKPEEIGGVKIPYHVQYALRLESDVKVAATFGRLDTSSEKMAFYVGAACSD
ncbi:MAG: sensory rhodopsin transducer [Candidatus Humimicrobiaceae bacterium]